MNYYGDSELMRRSVSNTAGFFWEEQSVDPQRGGKRPNPLFGRDVPRVVLLPPPPPPHGIL